MTGARLLVGLVTAGIIATGAVSTGAATAPTLRVSPTIVHRGDNVTFTGKHWGAKKKVTLRLGYANSEASAVIGTATTKADGSFRQVRPILNSAPTGSYVVLACRKNCAIKASKPLKIVQ